MLEYSLSQFLLKIKITNYYCSIFLEKISYQLPKNNDDKEVFI